MKIRYLNNINALVFRGLFVFCLFKTRKYTSPNMQHSTLNITLLNTIYKRRRQEEGMSSSEKEEEKNASHFNVCTMLILQYITQYGDSIFNKKNGYCTVYNLISSNKGRKNSFSQGLGELSQPVWHLCTVHSVQCQVYSTVYSIA